MKKDNKNPQPVPATLTLESLTDFTQHAEEITAKRVYLTVRTGSNDRQLVPSGAGSFVLVATARTAETVLQFDEVIPGVDAIDAFAARDECEATLNDRLDQVRKELTAAGFEVKNGRWSL